MAQGRLDFEVTQGEKLVFVIATDGDLTGYTAAMKARSGASTSSPAVLSLTSASGIALGGTAGTVTVTIDVAQSTALSPGQYPYNMMLTDTLGAPMELVNGTMTVDFNYSQ